MHVSPTFPYMLSKPQKCSDPIMKHGDEMLHRRLLLCQIADEKIEYKTIPHRATQSKERRYSKLFLHLLQKK